MPSRLVLWDIDGTLMRAGRIAADIFSMALEHVVGRHPGEHGVKMGGKTDPQIALEILAGMGIDARQGAEHLPLVLGRLEAELAGAVDLIREKGHLHPGVAEVLERLHHEDDRVAQTVLTGNTAANAITKLAAFDLDRWLDIEIGAFGSDNSDRRALVPIALERARQRRGWTLAPENLWVVGDTPHDLACAQAGGARCLLVCTGATPDEDVRQAGADAVFDDLSDVDAVVKLLRS
jgi:phosphoglycolate phosphatase-like HAD superfamily hydrolase